MLAHLVVLGRMHLLLFFKVGEVSCVVLGSEELLKLLVLQVVV